jgi:ribonuclease R
MSRQKKSSLKADPYAKREAEKYDKPIPSREFIMQVLAKVGKPQTFAQILKILKLKEKSDKTALNRRLKAMVRDGQLIHDRRKGFSLVDTMNLVRGRVIGHPDGYGFLVPEDDDGGDLFLSEKQMRRLIHGDRALVNVIGLDNKGRREGVVIEVLEHNTQEIVGRFFHKKGQNAAYVEPENRRISHTILIENVKRLKAKHGQIVVVQLISQPTKYSQATGKVIEILGDKHAPGMEIDIAIRSYDLPYKWSADVLKEVKTLPKKVTANAMKNREDMRDIPFVTIDGEDARDFDDAVHCEPRGKGWLLRVAIADVSAYVKPGTAIDLEAQERGTSVYFPNNVIPMLPEALSNQLCSLKPKVNRLAVVCELAIDFYGRIRRTRYFEAVIKSAARLTYTEVGQVLEGNEKDFKHPHVLPQIHNLYQLYQLLLNRRQKRGAIEFETREPKFVFDKQRKIQKILAFERNDAHKLIEEMMLCANVATAEWLEKHKMPLLYRIHEGPNEEKLTNLHSFLKLLGLKLWGKDKPEARHYSRLAEKVKDRPDNRLIQTVLLRSLKLAVYNPNNEGHFGLAYKAYTHFTSPIRRYPDLLVHRAIKHYLHNNTNEKFLYENNEMAILAEHCNTTERRAEDATREVISWLKCEYMEDKIGQEYYGSVTGVTGFGLFVELDDLFIDGLIHVASLTGDYYHFDPVAQSLSGERTGKTYRLLDKLHVRVVRVNLDDKKIDFELV